MTPTHSVIVPVLNGARLIAECLESILPQLGPDDELIVVDNGSTDATKTIVSAFADSRIVLLDQPRTGAAAARNMGLSRARGRYIAFQDHDDLWPPGRQAALLAALRSSPSANAAHGRARVIFEGEVDEYYLAMDGQFAHQHSMMTSLFERSLTQRAGFLDETLSLAEDVDYLVRLRSAGMVSAICEDVVHIRRRHNGNLTLRDTTSPRAQMMQVLRRSILRHRTGK